ncbi:MAG: Hsp70 family protein, partial [Nitrososphaerales archaeon]
APRGVPQIEVSFDIDANGILNVSAKDLATGKQTGITITASTKLSEKEKERMVKEAEQYADADKKKKEEAEIRNNADSLLYTVEKTKSDLKDKIPADLLNKLDNASKELKDVIGGADIDAIKQKTEALTNVLKEIGTVAYQQAAAANQQASGTTQSGQAGAEPSQKVVDAEYKVDDQKG